MAPDAFVLMMLERPSNRGSIFLYKTNSIQFKVDKDLHVVDLDKINCYSKKKNRQVY